jgi:mannose-6-phosphate isomerase-like protein (cupin superfamily)
MILSGTVIHQADCPIEGGDDPRFSAVTWRTLISGDRTPTNGLTMGITEVRETDAPFRLHRHAQAETYYILSGHGVISFEGVEQPLAPGDAVFIPGNLIHAARCVGSEPLRILYVFASDSFDQVEYEFPQ